VKAAKNGVRGGFLTLLLLGVGLSAAAGILLIDYSTHRLPGGAMDQADPVRLPAEGAYGDLANALDRSALVLETFNRDLAAARDPKAMSDAMDRLAADWVAVRDTMTAAAARHPELSTLPEPPEALRPVMERVDRAGKGFLSAQIRLADYIRDHPEAVDVIMAAFERLTAAKESTAPLTDP
jgi:hypothetical protein